MYAIIQDGGRQYRVEPGQQVDVDYRDASGGEKLKFDRVLAVSSGSDVLLGGPVVAGATVSAEVVGVVQGPKLTVVKFRRRKNSRRKTGHRQLYTRIRIGEIAAPGMETAKAPEVGEKPPRDDAPAESESAGDEQDAASEGEGE